MNVLLFGTFDGLHPGHRFVLNEAGKRGNVSVVIARDVSVQKQKGYFPSQGEDIRLESVARTYPSYTVLLGDENDYFEPIRRAHPDLILLGYDQKLPEGICEEDIPCPIERLGAFEAEKWKSSLLKKDDSLSCGL